MKLTKIRDFLPVLDDVFGSERLVREETVSARTLPPRLCCPATRNLEQRTRCLNIVCKEINMVADFVGGSVTLAAQVTNQRCNIIRLPEHQLGTISERWQLPYLEGVHHFLRPV